MAKESVESRKERAKNSTSPEELEKLAENEDERVRISVAGILCMIINKAK